VNKPDIKKLLNKRRNFITIFTPNNVNPTGHCNVDADMGAATEYRKQFNNRYPAVKLTFNDMIIKAAANALTKHPLYMCFYDGKYGIRRSERIDIQFPVDIGDNLGWGLVRNADKKSLLDIASESRASIEKTRREVPRSVERWDNIHTYHPYVGLLVDNVIEFLKKAGVLVPSINIWRRELLRRRRGTFLITNVGPAGIMRMEGPIVSPDILHLMITATRQTPVMVDGKVQTRPLMPLVAKFDCRATSAVQAARFLKDVKRNLEDPEHLLGPYQPVLV
jgi:pyruvate dehydrogenase E2 component (dihydrolipoamide acetyltransferase)